MSYHLDDTICAIATATGGAARGMVRVSGRDSVAVVAKLFEADDGESLEEVRRPTAIVGQAILNGRERPTNPPLAPPYKGGEIRRLPCDLFLWPGERSYTREPVAELHTLGSPPLLEMLLAAVCRAGARLAEPGEFTLRAFLAGRVDLTQAEGVLGVIDARGEGELRAAVAQLAGGLARPLDQLRDELLQLLAELEAGLDFVDEDIEFISAGEMRARIESANRLLTDVAEQMASRRTAGALLQIVLFGEPNAGKSSLFNALVARYGIAVEGERRVRMPALVSSQQGTTRDYLTSTIEFDGIRCELVDTAGAAFGTSDRILTAAQAMTTERRERAAIRAYCLDVSQTRSFDGAREAAGDIVVLTKIDTAPLATGFATAAFDETPIVMTSSRTGEGLDDLCANIGKLLTDDAAAQYGQVVAATAERCGESIRLAAAALARARDILDADGGNELIAAELRCALAELGKVVGAVYTEDVLDRIFSSFCIGK